MKTSQRVTRPLVAIAAVLLLAGCAAPRPIIPYTDGGTASSAGAGAVVMQGECSSAANCNRNKI